MILLLFISACDERYVISPILWGFYIFIIIFLFLNAITYNAMEYNRDSLCRLCGKKFSCEEIKEQEINEISIYDDYFVKVTRYWKCKLCGRVDIREGIEDIVPQRKEIINPSTFLEESS